MPNNKTVRNSHSRIVPIGAAAGMIKSSSSYGFTNILHDSELIVKSLENSNHPFYPRSSNWGSKVADAAMAYMVRHHPKNIEVLFRSLFEGLKTGDDILSFLDDRASLAKQVQIMKSVDPKIFFTAYATSAVPKHHVA